MSSDSEMSINLRIFSFLNNLLIPFFITVTPVLLSINWVFPCSICFLIIKAKDSISSTFFPYIFWISSNLCFNLYDNLNDRIDYIYQRLYKDKDPEWYLELRKINKKIEEKKKEVAKIKVRV